MFKKISRQLENKYVLIIGIFIAPFFLIPIVSGVLKLSLLLGELLPSYLILLEIDTSEKVSISTFIYYYTCFLAIEVTGILSNAVYKLSSYKEKKEKKDELLEKIIIVNRELRENLFVYRMELYTVGVESYNLKKIIQKEQMDDFWQHLRRRGLSFNTIAWEKYKYELDAILEKNNEVVLSKEINEIYHSIDILNKTKWSYSLHARDFEEFDVIIENINIKLEKIVQDIMDDKIKVHN
ncbi:hypothetical protein [Psychrobacillus psychrodurans]|uniref:hypothetical protein n=1 Tax=Psychrobacillus psychrodurans TaxID=126157 RepID=UPI003D023A93